MGYFIKSLSNYCFICAIIINSFAATGQTGIRKIFDVSEDVGALSPSATETIHHFKITSAVAGLAEILQSLLKPKNQWSSASQSMFDYLLSSASKHLFDETILPAVTKYFETLGNGFAGQEPVGGVGDTRAGWSPQYGDAHQSGGIAFPSLEGALLSLAFLTFAVFVVDLVQQVISRIRTGAAVPFIGRRRNERSIDTFDISSNERLSDNTVFSTLSSNIITAIENPLFQDVYD